MELVWSLSTRVFETRTATGSELFSLLTCLYTTTFTWLSILSPLEMIRIKIWETPLSCHAKCSLPVAVRVSKTRVLKLPSTWMGDHRKVLLTTISNLCFKDVRAHCYCASLQRTQIHMPRHTSSARAKY